MDDEDIQPIYVHCEARLMPDDFSKAFDALIKRTPEAGVHTETLGSEC
jgi:hypothetical protein